MNRNILGMIALFPALLAFAVPGGPDGEHAGRRVLLPAGEIHDGWYFAAGDEVTIEGTVNGDAYVTAGRVRVSGTVNGDLLVAGGQVTVSGTVTDDIRAAGGQVLLSGTTGKNISAAGGTVVLERTAILQGGLLAAGGAVTIAGTVAGEARVVAGEATLTGSVNRDLFFAGEELAVFRGATVGGRLEAMVEDSQDVTIAEGVVAGPVEVSTAVPARAARILGFSRGEFWFKVFWALSLIVTALVFALLFPRQLVEMGSTIAARPGASALWGILTFVLAPVVILVLMLTVVGLPLALFALVLYLWLLYLTQLSLGVVLSRWLMGLDGRLGWSLFGAVAVGVLAVQVLTFVPYVRHLITLLGIVFGLGALVLVLVREVQHHRALTLARPAAPGTV